MCADKYPCDACGEVSTILFSCEKCKAIYCSMYCKNEDNQMHLASCTAMGDAEITAVLKLFQIDEKTFSYLQDQLGRRFVPFPGKIHGETPRCMVEVYDRNGFGRKIWNDMDLPCGRLDICYYLVKREDLPKMIARINKEGMTNLLILLSQSPLNKKP